MYYLLSKKKLASSDRNTKDQILIDCSYGKEKENNLRYKEKTILGVILYKLKHAGRTLRTGSSGTSCHSGRIVYHKL